MNNQKDKFIDDMLELGKMYKEYNKMYYENSNIGDEILRVNFRGNEFILKKGDLNWVNTVKEMRKLEDELKLIKETGN